MRVRVYLGVGWQCDVEVTDGVLSQAPVGARLLHEGQAAARLLSVVSDLRQH